MDQSKSFTAILISVGIIGLVIILNVLIFFINNYMYPTINPSTDVVINSGISHSGIDGESGDDGINGIHAVNGNSGLNGKPGLNGRTGKVGVSGVKGLNGNNGEIGDTGNPGIVGLKGLPSNSKVSILNRYDMVNTDSYSMIDSFSFENVQYQVSLYTNIENNSRFVLKFGEDMVIPQTGFETNIPPMTLPTTMLDGGSFYSNLRIAIGYGRGNTNSTLRSDDTIFYVSPPISRRSFLFRYRLPANIPSDYEYLSIKFPVKPLNNSKDFYFYESEVVEGTSLSQELTLWKYHLFKGLGKYELVVNTFPPLPGNYNFNFRIIEEFTRSDSSDFALPKIVFPFNSTVLNFKQNGQSKISVSNRFDINRVIERDYNTDKIAWQQTSKKTIEIVTGEKEELIPFANAYQGLNNDQTISKNILANPIYHTDSGYTHLVSDGNALPLRGTFNQNFIKSNLQIYLGMRNYVPKVPLDKFKNLEKLYLKIWFQPFNLSSNADVVFTYGEEFSFDLIDFQTVYSKNIFLSLINKVTTNSSNEIVSFEPSSSPITPSDKYLFPYQFHVIEVGYTKYSTKERFTTYVEFQNSSNFYNYYFNIPLYGYKKR